MSMLRTRAAQDGPSRRDFLRPGAATVAAAAVAAPAVPSQEPRPNSRSTAMDSNRIRVGKENSTNIELYYEDRVIVVDPDSGKVLGEIPGLNRAHGVAFARSEEHTSELQSQSNLVCRLLL